MNDKNNQNNEDQTMMDKAVNALEKKPDEEKTPLNSSTYSTIAKIVFGIYMFLALLLYAEEIGAGLVMSVILFGYLNYLLINWFGLVLKGLEENNKLLSKLVNKK